MTICDDLYRTHIWETSYPPHNSSLEGATKLKRTPFCSSYSALSDGILFNRSRNFQILAENHDCTIVRRFDQISFRTHYSSREGATELKFVPVVKTILVEPR